ncbi:MAG TPA: hypothetical protein VGN60_09195 [Devosia sp.]|jgi:hypothetical protein|nr:hypothetical protein [Devosia sp.]
MPVFRSAGEVYQTEGSRIVWSTTRAPALLVPGSVTTLTNFDISFPHPAMDSAYALDVTIDPTFGTTLTNCATWASMVPGEWDSGLSGPIALLPAGVNHFEIEVELSRVVEPSSYAGKSFPKSIAEGQRTWLNGGACELERAGPLIRIFRFERSGNGIYLRRKQSIKDAGNLGIWAPGNSQYTGAGGYQEGWTYTSDPRAWPAHLIETRSGGNVNKRRGEANACSIVDNSNYASTWRGTVIITPGHIKP